jgi:hypothetical protein
LKVADPGLEGGKVAVLRPHAACHSAECRCNAHIYIRKCQAWEGALHKKTPINVQAAILHKTLSEGHASRK